MSQKLLLSPFADLSAILSKEKLVAFGVGFDGLIYLAIATRSLDYRIEKTGGASYAKTIPDKPQSYRVVALYENRIDLDITITNEQFNIHYIQPLTNNKILLACARSRYKNPKEFEKNGRIYTINGEFSRGILLGDGIQDIQTTSDGLIWTSFFDEGVFGNYGWQEPVGASGLVAWDSRGSKVYEFQPTKELDSICDCYALNVNSNADVWFYYYTDFPLVRLNQRQLHSFWNLPISGSNAFAISGYRVLFHGGYDDRNTYHLFKLDNDGKFKQISSYQFIDEEKNKIVAERVVGRGSYLYILKNMLVYRVDMSTIQV